MFDKIESELKDIELKGVKKEQLIKNGKVDLEILNYLGSQGLQFMTSTGTDKLAAFIKNKNSEEKYHYKLIEVSKENKSEIEDLFISREWTFSDKLGNEFVFWKKN